MQVKKAPMGHELQVGDFIKSESGITGIRWYKVSRVTAKFAFIKYNEVAEGKYHRKVTGAMQPCNAGRYYTPEEAAYTPL